MKKLRLLRKPLSLSAYAAVFVTLTLCLFAILGALTLSQLESAREKISRVHQESAEREFAYAVAQVEGAIRARTLSLAEWDEVHQQLSNPTYYAYWREHRLMKSDMISSYIKDAEIYNGNKKGLAINRESPLPHNLSDRDLRPQVTRQGDNIYLTLYTPIQDHEQAEQLIGHVGVRVSFDDLFHSLNRFRFLDETSLIFNLDDGMTIPLSDIAQQVSYALRSNPEAQAVQEVMETAVLRLAVTIGILAIIFYVLLATLLGMPLRRLSQVIDQMKHGPESHAFGSGQEALPIAELEKVRHSLHEYQSQLSEVHNNLDEKNKALWEMAHHDPLTGAFNRRAFDHDWNQLRGNLEGKPLDVAFILFDCNHFKAINDTYGHQAGDQVIRALAHCIRDGLRLEDKLYRIGGDEFATILLHCSEDCARDVAQRCIQMVQDTDFNNIGIKEPVRVSIGVAHTASGQIDDLGALQWQADIAMYRAKRPGSGHLQFYTDDMKDGAANLVSSWISNALYDAIGNGKGIEIHYQPILNLSNNQIEYYEALVRIRNNDGLIMPGNFLPLVEARRLELEFDIAVLRAIRHDLSKGVIPPGTGVSINLSGHSVAHNNIVENLWGFAPYQNDYKLLLEVTETALITQLESATTNHNKARKCGFTIALDDFGSGYSSLSYLSSMPVDIVKFDITMIHQMAQGGRQRIMLEQLARMISEAGYRLVAEGIENQELHTIAEESGFHYVQGYLHGRPSRSLLHTSAA